ncbi:MAG: hypothetical protein LC737_03330, partial [Chloroflexi bacterium]|nr:hypothetical protein [Chloroflexota bacterium]
MSNKPEKQEVSDKDLEQATGGASSYSSEAAANAAVDPGNEGGTMADNIDPGAGGTQGRVAND